MYKHFLKITELVLKHLHCIHNNIMKMKKQYLLYVNYLIVNYTTNFNILMFLMVIFEYMSNHTTK